MGQQMGDRQGGREMNERIVDELDKQFPKGDKARGRALVLNAIAQIEIEKTKKIHKDFVEKLKKMIDKYVSENIEWAEGERLRSELKEEINRLNSQETNPKEVRSVDGCGYLEKTPDTKTQKMEAGK